MDGTSHEDEVVVSCGTSLIIRLFVSSLTFAGRIGTGRTLCFRLYARNFQLTLRLAYRIANLLFDNVCLSLRHPTDEFCFFFYNWFVYWPFVTHLTIGRESPHFHVDVSERTDDTTRQ